MGFQSIKSYTHLYLYLLLCLKNGPILCSLRLTKNVERSFFLAGSATEVTGISGDIVRPALNQAALPLQYRVKRGFHPTQRTQHKERNEMTSLLDRPITATSDDGVCRWHAAKLWETHAVKYEIIEIKFDLHHM